MIRLVSEFVMKPGKVAGALRLVRAVEREAKAKQPGTLVYFAHRVVKGKKPRPTRTLLFYECYRNHAALMAHLNSASWQALVAGWSSYFERTSQMGKGVTVISLDRLAGFARTRS